MSDVAVVAVVGYLEVYERGYGGPLPPELFEGLSFTPRELPTRRARIPWDEFATLNNRFAALLGSEERIAEIGELVDTAAHWVNLLAANFVSPLQLYLLWQRLCPQVFGPLHVLVREVSGGRVEVVISLEPDRLGCRPFFRGSVGALEGMTRRIGLPPGKTEYWDVGSHHGVFVVRPPASRTLPARIMSGLDSFLALIRDDRAVADRALSRLGEVEGRLAEFARQLDRIGVAGREIAASADEAALAARVAEIAVTELGYAACRVAVDGPSGPREHPVRGSPLGPSRAHALTRDGRSLGTVFTWGDPAWNHAIRPLLPFALAGLDHLRALEEERALIRRLQEERDRLDAALSRPEPMWILHGSGAVEWANEAGRAALQADPTLEAALAAGEAPGLRVAPIAGGARLVSRPDGARELAGRLARHSLAWGLTPAQSRALGAAAEGLSQREIADRLGLSEKTVEAHLGEVYRKAGVGQRGELVAAFWSR